MYFTGGDADALRAARTGRVLVATARELPTIREAGVELDALVRSANDPGEAYDGSLVPPPRLDVATEGSKGGRLEPGGRFEAVSLPGPLADSYGAGDAFAAGLTFALGEGRSPPTRPHSRPRSPPSSSPAAAPTSAPRITRSTRVWEFVLRCGPSWGNVGRSGGQAKAMKCSSAPTNTHSTTRTESPFPPSSARRSPRACSCRRASIPASSSIRPRAGTRSSTAVWPGSIHSAGRRAR